MERVIAVVSNANRRPFVLSVFNSKSGTAAFNTGNSTYSDVSCHGGQSVSWSATINVTPGAAAPPAMKTRRGDGCFGPAGSFG